MSPRSVLARFAPLLVLAAPTPWAAAPAQKAMTAQSAVTFFVEAQDVPPFTPNEMTERAKTLGDEPEAIAADASLNQWKQCVQDSLIHWAPLNQGPGTLIDGAFGRCADLERDYRAHLVRMTPGGRAVVDVQLARNMTRTLEESWRPRLTAAVLDQMLAKQPVVATTPTVSMKELSGRTKEERTTPRS